MFAGLKLHDIPGRAIAGAYILHEGLGKWGAPAERAAGLHAAASGAFPLFKSMDPKTFSTLLSAAEIATGGALLLPFVPTALAGVALTGFAGGLVTMYLRTPVMHKEGSIWPSPKGVAVSKDSWLLALGMGMVLDGVGRRAARQRRKIAKAARQLVRRQQAELEDADEAATA
jgi:hypothetical protein